MLNAKSNKAFFFMFSCQILMIFHRVDIIKNDQNLVAKTEEKKILIYLNTIFNSIIKTLKHF